MLCLIAASPCKHVSRLHPQAPVYGSKGKAMYAIVKTGGKQYTVRPGDVFDVEKLPGQPGDTVSLPVLFLNDGTNIVTSADELAGVEVTAEIVEQHRGDKQIVFKFKKRKGYKRTRGHRQYLTKIAIVNVNGETAEAPKPRVPVAEAAEEAPVAEDAPVVEEAAVEETPVVEEAAAPEAEPAVEEAPEAEVAEEPVAADEPSAEEPAAEADEAPAVEEPAEEQAAEEPAAEEPADLSKLTVAQLRELAKEKGVKIPSGSRKADIIELIESAE